MRWFVRGDLDGFFGLALDNLIQLLLIDALCRGFLGFPAELVHSRILPGAAMSLLIGNVYYARQAALQAVRTGQRDLCALPYGINTVALFAFVFLVMAPAKFAAEAAGSTDPSTVAWHAGLLACLGSGLIEFCGSFVAPHLRKISPRAALLSTLAGIAMGFIAMGFLFRTYANPVVGLTTLGVVVLTYFGRVRFKGKIPGGLVAVLLGITLSWTMGLAPTSATPTSSIGLHLPIPAISELFTLFSDPTMLLTYGAVVLPMGMFSVIGSLQNLESAQAAGDHYPTAPSLAVNGLGTMVAASFGSCFPTTLYIGHPGWKAMGARSGYSLLSGIFIALVVFSGSLGHIAWAVPIDAGMAIVLWIGLVMGAQAFEATPRKHAPAVVMGLLPGLAAWGAMLAKQGVRVGASGPGSNQGEPWGPWVVDRFLPDTWIHGAFALEQGFIFTSMILAATTVEVIDSRFRRAGLWMLAGAAFSAMGLIHSYEFTFADTRLALHSAWPWTVGYGLVALLLFIAPWVTEANDDGHEPTARNKNGSDRSRR